MKINTIPMTANIPSGFAMPACGHAPETFLAGFGTTSVVRDRQAVIKADMGLAAYVPGTSAWSPPPS